MNITVTKKCMAILPVLLYCISALAQDSFPVLKGDYLGQHPPGKNAVVFAKGIISTEKYEHSAPAFSPDGKTVLWGVIERDKPAILLQMDMINGVWSKPVKPSFASETDDDMYPSFSPDGKKLFFCSRRPLPAGRAVADLTIWVVDRNPVGWGQPYLFDTTVCKGYEYAHAISKNGTIVFSTRQVINGKPVWNIYSSGLVNGKYTQPQLLDTNINKQGYKDGPMIAKDESFLIFESDRAGGFGDMDLYICFKQKDGSWGLPKNMGPKVNSPFGERFAGISPDGKYLFFGSNRGGGLPDVYWIDVKVIDEIRD